MSTNSKKEKVTQGLSSVDRKMLQCVMKQLEQKRKLFVPKMKDVSCCSASYNTRACLTYQGCRVKGHHSEKEVERSTVISMAVERMQTGRGRVNINTRKQRSLTEVRFSSCMYRTISNSRSLQKPHRAIIFLNIMGRILKRCLK